MGSVICGLDDYEGDFLARVKHIDIYGILYFVKENDYAY